MNLRLALLNRREHLTQKIKITGQRTLYVSVHNDEQPTEIFLTPDIETSSRPAHSSQ
jgi:hypothetical protein